MSSGFLPVGNRTETIAWLTRETPLLRQTEYRQQSVSSSDAPPDTLRILWKSATDEEDVEVLELLARYARNCCVEDEGRQAMISIEGCIRDVLFKYSSFASLSDPFHLPLLHAHTQLLSNMAASPETAGLLLPLYVQGPFDKCLAVRLLASEDTRTLLGVVTFLFLALDSAPNLSFLFLDKTGLSIVELLLRKMEKWFEAADETEGSRCFELGYEFIKLLSEHGHVSTLYLALADGIAKSPISLAQSLLLKLFDAFLHSPASSTATFFSQKSLSFLLPTTQQLANELLRPMRALKEGGKRTVFAEEGFAKCYEGFSLGLKDVIFVALLGAEDKQDEDEDGRKEAGSRLVTGLEDGIFLNSSIELLMLSDFYEPRLVRSSSTPDITDVDGKPATHAFAPVRKDIARLLGIYASSSRAAQDQLAQLGALEVLLGMCALDTQNPFLREHSLFAVRSMLLHNPDNQARVKELEPQATLNEDGQIGEVPDRWKK